MVIDQTTQEQQPGLTTGTLLPAALSHENSGPVVLTVLNEPFQLPRRSTGATKPDVVVPVIRIVPVAIGGAEILRIIVVPRTAPIRPLSLLIMTETQSLPSLISTISESSSAIVML